MTDKDLQDLVKTLARSVKDFIEQALKDVQDKIATAEKLTNEKHQAWSGISDMVQRHEKALAELPKPIDGRDALAIDILPDIDPAKAYPRGTFATHKGGLWRCKVAVAGIDAWECIVRGIAETEISLDDDRREITIKQMLSDGQSVSKVMAVPTMIYRGVYSAEKDYRPGDAVTLGGSIWHCDQPNRAVRPGTIEGNKNWTLAVKRGSDARSNIRSEA